MTRGQWLSCSSFFPIGTWSFLRLTSGSQLTLQDLASFQPEVVDALAMPLGDYILYSPPPPAGGAILSFILNVLKGEASGPESSCPAGNLNFKPSHALGQLLPFPVQPPPRMQKTGLWKWVKMVCSRAGLGALLKGLMSSTHCVLPQVT